VEEFGRVRPRGAVACAEAGRSGGEEGACNKSRVMQSTNQPPHLLDEDGADTFVEAPEPEHEPAVNGRRPADTGSEAYVHAWDVYVRETATTGARRQRARSVHLAREVVETAIFALLMFLAVRAVVQNFRVEGLSMDPTYRSGQYVLVNHALYARIGDLINWIPLGETYLGGVETTCFGQWCDVTLGRDEYYVLGDNRPNSSDSRFWGPVRGEKIVGKAWLIYLPIKDFGPAPNKAPALLEAE
jgi:signal peptidase I